MKPLGRVSTIWSPELAYAVGLIVTDGSLSIDGRHINLTSKDPDQLESFQRCLGTALKIGSKRAGRTNSRDYYQVQIGDVLFYRFLQSIGLTPNKTKTIGVVQVPNAYFRDFLRGHLDGDGATYSYFDPRWPSSFLLYTTFISASRQHIDWLAKRIVELFGVSGRIGFGGKVWRLRFAKYASVKLLPQLYYRTGLPSLERKRLKIERALATIGSALLPEAGDNDFAQVEELEDSLP